MSLTVNLPPPPSYGKFHIFFLWLNPFTSASFTWTWLLYFYFNYVSLKRCVKDAVYLFHSFMLCGLLFDTNINCFFKWVTCTEEENVTWSVLYVVMKALYGSRFFLHMFPWKQVMEKREGNIFENGLIISWKINICFFRPLHIRWIFTYNLDRGKHSN